MVMTLRDAPSACESIQFLGPIRQDPSRSRIRNTVHPARHIPIIDDCHLHCGIWSETDRVGIETELEADPSWNRN
jgi:hypothetical protein